MGPPGLGARLHLGLAGDVAPYSDIRAFSLLLLLLLFYCTINTRPRRVFGKRPPAPRKPKGKPGRPFVGAHGGGSAFGRFRSFFCDPSRFTSRNTLARRPLQAAVSRSSVFCFLNY